MVVQDMGGGLPVLLKDWRFVSSSLLKLRICKITGIRKKEEIKIDCLNKRRHKMWRLCVRKGFSESEFWSRDNGKYPPPKYVTLLCRGTVIAYHKFIIIHNNILYDHSTQAASLVWYINNESIALLWLLYNSLLLYMFVYIYIIYLLSSLDINCLDASYAYSFHQLFF